MAERYKRYVWIQRITLVLSFLSCIVPVFVSALRAAPAMQTTESKWALGGVAAFFAVIISLIVCRSFIRKYISKLPYTLTVLISVTAMLLFVVCLKEIVDDAIAILFVGVIGAGIGFVLELVSMYCGAMAQDVKMNIRGGRNNE